MYNEKLALNNLQWLILHKIKSILVQYNLPSCSDISKYQEKVIKNIRQNPREK